MRHKRFYGFAVFDICPCDDTRFTKIRNHVLFTVVRKGIDREVTAARKGVCLFGHLTWTSVIVPRTEAAK